MKEKWVTIGLVLLLVSTSSNRVIAEGDQNIFISFKDPSWEYMPKESSQMGYSTFLFHVTIEIWNNSTETVSVTHGSTCGFYAELDSADYAIQNSPHYPCGQLVTQLEYEPGLTTKDYEFYASLDTNSTTLPVGEYILYYRSIWNNAYSYNTTIIVGEGTVDVIQRDLPTTWGEVPLVKETQDNTKASVQGSLNWMFWISIVALPVLAIKKKR